MQSNPQNKTGETMEGFRVEQVLELWKKYFSRSMKPCTDCGGWSVLICEKVMRDFVKALVGNMDRTIENNVQSALSLQAKEIVEMVRDMDGCPPYGYEKSLYRQTCDDIASRIESKQK